MVFAWYSGVFDDIVVNGMDAHPNELANRVAAEEIAKQLLRELGN